MNIPMTDTENNQSKITMRIRRAQIKLRARNRQRLRVNLVDCIVERS